MRLFAKISLAVFVLVVACREEESIPRIKNYSPEWEANLLTHYAGGVDLYFQHVFSNADGSLYVVHSNPHENHYVITKLSSAGEFIDDLALKGEYISQISKGAGGEMISLSSDNSNWYIKIWNQNLAVLRTVSMPYQGNIKIHKSGFFKIELQASQHWNVSKFSLEEELQWVMPLPDCGIIGLADPILSAHDDNLFFAEHTPHGSVALAKVNGLTGEIIWKKEHLNTDLNEWGAVGSYLPLVSGWFLINGSDYSNPRAIYNTVVDESGTLHSKYRTILPDTNPSASGRVLELKDGGYLVTLVPIWQDETASFRLLKTDAGFVANWIGSFKPVSAGELSDIIETADGHLALVTTKGYLFSLKPNY